MNDLTRFTIASLAFGFALSGLAGCKQTTSPSEQQPRSSATPATPAAKATSTNHTATKPGASASAGGGQVLDMSRLWDFDKDQPGAVPADFEVASGAWKVVKGDEAGGKGNVVMQTNAGSGGDFNVLLSKAMKATDVDLTVRMRAHTGKIDQGGGLVWRAKDVKNYYVARYNPLEDNYRLYFVQNGRRAMIATADVHIDKKAWHTLRVTMKGADITCYLDGKKELTARDQTFTQAGKVGLWTKADAVTWFDDLSLKGK